MSYQTQIVEALDVLPVGDLEQLRQVLAWRRRTLGDPAERRERLGALGTFRRVESAMASGEHWGAVDGSVVSLGGPFPYVVEVYRVLARDTRGGEIVENRLFCPLRGEDMALFRDRGGQDEDSLAEFRRGLLTEMELAAGRYLVQRERPALLLLDGGLLPLSRRAGAAWRALQAAADAVGTLLVGVVEDVATRSLAPAAGIPIPAFDREVLYGVLQPGEAFLPGPAVAKEGIATAFVRWGQDPRPTAVEVRVQDAGQLPRVLERLAATVPRHGRGTPLWLDLVDRDVRLRHEDIEMWLQTALGPVYDQWLLPNRRRRDY